MTEAPQEYITDALEMMGAGIADKICGIYFLTHESKIVYIGQSINIKQRISQHIKQGEKIFDGFSFIECSPRELSWKEAKYINKFNPKYNKIFPSCYEKMDWWRVKYINEYTANFPTTTFEEWMSRTGKSKYTLYEKDDFIEFSVFADWWKLTHKRMDTWHCLPSDVVKWIDLGKPTVDELP